MLIGFDFPFGWPQGAAAALSLAEPGWRGIWTHLAGAVADQPDNRNNRFEVAAALNRRLPRPQFWGRPVGLALDGLPARKPADPPLPERRAVERHVPRAQPAWKLYTTGSVGGQCLTGLPRLEALRAELGAVVWPFETGFAPPEADLVLAEVYPSLVPIPDGPEPKDARQVDATALRLRAACRSGEMADWLTAPTLTAAERAAATAEEGWILGAPALAPPRRTRKASA